MDLGFNSTPLKHRFHYLHTYRRLQRSSMHTIINKKNSYRSRTPGYESQGAEGMAPDLDNKIIHPNCTLLNRHPYLQQILLHNLVFLPEQLFHVPVDADVATGEPLLPFLRQIYNGAGCQLDGIDQYCCEMNVRGLLWSFWGKR